MYKKHVGQSIIEFVLIISLVAIGCIAILGILGNNVTRVYTDSNNAVASYNPLGNGSSVTTPPVASTPTSTTPTTPSTTPSTTTTTSTSSTPNVVAHSDGSATLSVSGQDIYIPTALINDLNTVYQTTGSSGLTSEVQETIASLVEKYKDDYSGQNVPINVQMGYSARAQESPGISATFEGDASINSVNISVGDHLVMMQFDQACSSTGCPKGNTHKIEFPPGSSEGIVSSSMAGLDGTTYRIKEYDSAGWPKNGIIESQAMEVDSWKFDFTGNKYGI